MRVACRGERTYYEIVELARGSFDPHRSVTGYVPALAYFCTTGRGLPVCDGDMYSNFDVSRLLSTTGSGRLESLVVTHD